MSSDETITKAELEAALSAVEITVGKPFSYSTASLMPGYGQGKPRYPSVVANMIMSHAVKHREPEYKEGSIYRDKDGDVYQYDVRYDGTKRWYEPGNSEAVAFDIPSRPLTELK